TFTGVRAGTGYSVSAQRTGYTVDTATGVTVTAHVTSSVSQLSIAPDTSGSIAGTVFGAPDVGLAGVAVDLIGTDLNGRAVSIAGAATTDTNGAYSIGTLAQGTYAVTYRKDRYQSRTVSGVFLAAGQSAQVPDQLPLEVARATVSGTVSLS